MFLEVYNRLVPNVKSIKPSCSPQKNTFFLFVTETPRYQNVAASVILHLSADECYTKAHSHLQLTRQICSLDETQNSAFCCSQSTLVTHTNGLLNASAADKNQLVACSWPHFHARHTAQRKCSTPPERSKRAAVLLPLLTRARSFSLSFHLRHSNFYCQRKYAVQKIPLCGA